MFDRIGSAIWEFDQNFLLATPPGDPVSVLYRPLPSTGLVSSNERARRLMEQFAHAGMADDAGYALPLDHAIVARAIQAFQAGEQCFVDGIRLDIAGELRCFHIALSFPIAGVNSGTVVMSATDITQQRREEADLQAARRHLEHASRAMNMVHLARSLTDAVSQPLTSILFSGHAALNWLDKSAQECPELAADINRMVVAASRSADMIRQAREYADSRESQLETLILKDVFQSILPRLEGELTARGSGVIVDVADDLPNVTADRVQIEQVLLNLILNAIEAHDDAEVRSSIRVSARVRESAEVMVSIEDDGAGIAAEFIDRIFEPLFTTKPGSIGVGLAVCRTIVEAHGGEIWVSESRKSGTTFNFSLPADGAIEATEPVKGWRHNAASGRLQ
ncbi:sensor histidine kinase [Novosphingobium sp.]|jgi:signal transduction histidine kinase|uniref:sensor histidine kinase n=1 Tax=Novosphingobium sp. TaxID=1874826 RepID=UPI002FE022EC